MQCNSLIDPRSHISFCCVFIFITCFQICMCICLYNNRNQMKITCRILLRCCCCLCNMYLKTSVFGMTGFFYSHFFFVVAEVRKKVKWNDVARFATLMRKKSHSDRRIVYKFVVRSMPLKYLEYIRGESFFGSQSVSERL